MQTQTQYRKIYALWFLKIYVLVLGGLLLHIHIDEHHHIKSDHICHTDVHYHETSEDCSLNTHTLAPTLSVPSVVIEEPLPQYCAFRFVDVVKAEVGSTYRFYYLRAPPVA